jgi:predicted O-methyltransferase YrrM
MSVQVFWVLTLALQILVVAAVYMMYRKLSRQAVMLRHEATLLADNTVTQVECLLALYADLKPARGLPRTRGWAASPDFLHALAAAVDARKPQTVVECSSGLSTLVLASKLRQQGNGHVYSLEHLPEYAQKTRELLRAHGLEAWATVLDSPLGNLALPAWQGHWYGTGGLTDVKAIDLLVVDGPPQGTGELARYPAFPALKDKLAPGAQIILDDADRDAEIRIVARWLSEFPGLEHVQAPKCEKGCVIVESKPR